MAETFLQHFMYALTLSVCLLGTAEGTVSCSFESGTCGWHRVGSSSFQWRSYSGPSPDMTSGPLNDHTCKNHNGQYLFISGADAQPQSDVAILESESFGLANISEFQFWYLMNGIGVGNMSLAFTTTASVEKVIWRESGRQDRGWKKASVKLSPGNMTLRFMATVRLPYGSDLAIDDVRLSSEDFSVDTSYCISPPKSAAATTTTTITTKAMTTTVPSPTTAKTTSSHKSSAAQSRVTLKTSAPTVKPSSSQCSMTLPWSCDFSSGVCCLRVIPSTGSPVVTWKRTNEKDGNRYDGQIAGGHNGGFYLHYTVQGFGMFSSPNTTLETPVINSINVSLTFWYNMPTRYSNLQIYVQLVGGHARPIWKGQKATSGWHYTTLSVTEDLPYKIMFQAQYQSRAQKIGLDDISIVEIIPPSQTEPENASTTPNSLTTPSAILSASLTSAAKPPKQYNTSSTQHTRPSATIFTSEMSSKTTVAVKSSKSSTPSGNIPANVTLTPTPSAPVTTSATMSLSSTASSLSSGNGLSTKQVSKKPKPTDQKKPISEKSTDNKVKVKTIVGGSVGGVVALALVMVIIYVIHVRMKRKPSNKRSNKESSRMGLAVANGKGSGTIPMGFTGALYENVEIEKVGPANGKLTNGHASTGNGKLRDYSESGEITHL